MRTLDNKQKVKRYLKKIGFHNVTNIKFQRNRNFLIFFKKGNTSFLLKQRGQDNTVFNTISLENEILFLQNLKDDISLSKKIFLPKIYNTDSVNELFISKKYESYKTVSCFKINQKLFSDLGKYIASFHRIKNRELTHTLPIIKKETFFHNLNIFHPEVLTNGGPNILTYIKCIQKYPDVLENLYKLSESYEYNAFIHGDLKFDNILARKAKQYHIKFIDFEFTTVGDRHYDLGYILGNLLFDWIIKMNLKKQKPDYKKQYFNTIIHCFKSCIHTYEEQTKSIVNMELTLKYAGFYLLKIFFNCSMDNRTLNKTHFMFVQVARNYIVHTKKQLKSFTYDQQYAS